ncbi:MAG: endonuclease/exonuclease/phosphatase family protein, partial [Anaerolineales bacterium]|nr:endonuclease/exonuclease/phosphatase family protein [Anaerolineales bacterium]
MSIKKRQKAFHPWLCGALLAFCLLAWVIPGSAAPQALVSICVLQGSGLSSPYWGQTVRTRGVVTLDLDQAWQKGFYIQANHCDSDARTSDGIYVYLGEKVDVVSSGDRVEVSGQVNEYYGLSEVLVAPENVTILSHGNPLPAAQQLSPPFSNEAARAYFEAREGMYVALGQGRVVGPTDVDERTWLVRADLGIVHVFHDDPAGTGELICADDGGPFAIDSARVSDLVGGVLGVVEQRFGKYCLALAAAPQVSTDASFANPQQSASASMGFTFDVATFNLANLFDTVDDPATDDSVLSGAEYLRRLHKRALAIHDELGEPAVLAVQEAENQAVLEALLAQAHILSGYGVLLVDGPDRRGLDIGLLYRKDQVQLLDYQVHQGCTRLVDGLGPDGNLDMADPKNTLTCDRDGDGILDGNRLFSRPPLAARLRIYPAGCLDEYGALLQRSPSGCDDSLDIWLVNNHWKSKTQDTSSVEYTLPRRRKQAVFVASLLDSILAADPGANVIVLGDLNDDPDSIPLAVLQGRVSDLSARVNRQERYTYIYQGISQVLDYVLMWPALDWGPLSVTPVHINADYPYDDMGESESAHRSSDHDPLLVWFGPYQGR